MKNVFLTLALALVAVLPVGAQTKGQAAVERLGQRKVTVAFEASAGTAMELGLRLHARVNDYLAWGLGAAYRYDYNTPDYANLNGQWGYLDDRSHGVKVTTGLRASTPAFGRRKYIRASLGYYIGWAGVRRERDYRIYRHYSSFGDYDFLHHAAADITAGFTFWNRLYLGYSLGLLSGKGGETCHADHMGRIAITF